MATVQASILSINDLFKGMKVRASQLSQIFGQHIILTNPDLMPDGDIEGVIGYIGESLDDESDGFNGQGVPIAHIYNDADEKDGEVYFDE